MAVNGLCKSKRVILILLLLLGLCFYAGCSNQNTKDIPGMKTDTSKTDTSMTVTPKTDTSKETSTVTITPSPFASPSPAADQSPAPTQAALKIGWTAVTEDTSGKTREKLKIPSASGLQKPETDYVTDEMFGNAVLSEGNTARLAAAMSKAKNGEEITVGVIGGSITQGCLAADSQNAYGIKFYSWWHKTFPDIRVNYVNAGIGATNSYLGVHRADMHLLYKKPDVVVVEFSVNDSNTPFYEQTYEDLVRKILKSENNPAVILLYMTMEDGTSAEQVHMAVGEHYDLPQISYRQAILNEIKKGSLTWRDISPDNIHPNDKGHQIAGELLWHYLNYIYSKLDTITEKVKPLDIKPLFDEAYADAEILDSENLIPVKMGSFTKRSVYDRFRNNWFTQKGEQSIVFEVEARNIGIMYYRTTDGKCGQYDVYIDDKQVKTLDGNFAGGWGNYAETAELYKSSEKAKHKIEIKKSKNSKESIFTICGLLVS